MNYAHNSCAVILDTELFGACHGAVDPEPYYQMCLQVRGSGFCLSAPVTVKHYLTIIVVCPFSVCLSVYFLFVHVISDDSSSSSGHVCMPGEHDAQRVQM